MLQPLQSSLCRDHTPEPVLPKNTHHLLTDNSIDTFYHWPFWSTFLYLTLQLPPHFRNSFIPSTLPHCHLTPLKVSFCSHLPGFCFSSCLSDFVTPRSVISAYSPLAWISFMTANTLMIPVHASLFQPHPNFSSRFAHTLFLAWTVFSTGPRLLPCPIPKQVFKFNLGSCNI